MRVAAVAVTLVALGGCGDAGDGRAKTVERPASTGVAQPEAPAPGRVFSMQEVEGALLSAADLPTGWTTEPDEESSPSDSSGDYAQCPALGAATKRLARKESRDVSFSSPAGSDVGEQIVSLSEDDTKKLLADFSAGVTACKKVSTTTDDGPPLDIHLSALSFPSLADETFAFRERATLYGATINVDLILVRRGGLLIVITHRARGVIDTTMTEDVARRALAKADKTLK